ncbi:MAG: S-layer homology domain-containing protein, partial [Acidimicrobiales bacterium]
VYGHLTPSYSLHEIGFVGWTVERFRPDDPIEVEVAVDGVTTTVLADADVADSYPAVAAATAHGFSRVVPIDLDTRSITVTAKAADGRTASLMDLVLYAGFIDVEPDRFYADAVYWLRQNDLTTGTRPGLFEPRDFITRGQMAVFLWRFMDEPAASEATPFTDVADESYAAAAVRWLHGAGITTGVTPDTFAPDDFVTRGQMATFLWRLCGRIEPSAPSPFEDLVPGAFYETPVSWLDETGITTGVTPTRFAPDDAITRGEMAVFLMRLATTPEAWTRIEPPSVVAAAPAP